MQNLWTYIKGLNLNYDNRHWLAERLIEPTHEKENLTPYTVEELIAGAEEGHRQIESGNYLNSEEVFEELFAEFGIAQELQKEAV